MDANHQTKHRTCRATLQSHFAVACACFALAVVGHSQGANTGTSYTVVLDLPSSPPVSIASTINRQFAVSARHSREWPDVDIDQAVLVDECERYVKTAPTADAYGEFLDRQLQTAGEQSPIRGYLLTRKGIYQLLRKEYGQALATVDPVVQGTVPARKVDRIVAMRRVAWIKRQQGDLVGALQAYQEIEGCSGSDLVIAQAQTEQAGLLIELGKGQGNLPIPGHSCGAAFEAARSCCQRVSSGGEEVPPEHKMQADLMHFESYFFQGNYRQSYEGGVQFFRKWGESPDAYADNQIMRIYINTAKGFHVQSCYLTGRLDEALQLAELLANRPPPKADQFEKFDVFMRGIAVAQVIHAEQGNAETAARLEEYGTRTNATAMRSLQEFLMAGRPDPERQ